MSAMLATMYVAGDWVLADIGLIVVFGVALAVVFALGFYVVRAAGHRPE